jgi:hypothetical protein
MNAQEILEAAADRVEAGWCQGRMSNDAGDVCALGALIAVVDSMANLEESVAWEALCDEVGCAASAWNDEPGRTRYDVSDAMRRAAKTLANEAPSPGMTRSASTGEGKNPTPDTAQRRAGGVSETAAGADLTPRGPAPAVPRGSP